MSLSLALEMAQDLLRRTVIENEWIPHTPTEKQAAFLSLPHQEAFYGGAAGGGKSDALLMAALQFVDYPMYSALILRRSVQDLSLPGALLDRAHMWLAPTSAHWKADLKQYQFPSGATLNFGYLEYERDKYRYQSSEFDCICFDETTQFSSSQYTYLFSRLRKQAGQPYPLRMRSASNPGNEGHEWVKQRFVDPGSVERPFIPARLIDNPFIDQPSYQHSLAQLDPLSRSQLELGVWDEPPAVGAYYGKWLEEAEKEGRVGFVPYERGLPVTTFWDLGVAKGRDSMVVIFVQQAGKEIRIIDSFGDSGEGFPHYVKMLQEKGYIYGQHFAPWDITIKEMGSGKTRLEQAAELGINFEQVPQISFDEGVNSLRTIFPRLWFDKDHNEKLIRALKLYRKEWDEEHQIFKSFPRKDWTGDYCDALRMLALGWQDPKKIEPLIVHVGFDARHFPQSYLSPIASAKGDGNTTVRTNFDARKWVK